MSKLEWLGMNSSEYEAELEDANHLVLLEIVTKKYKMIGEPSGCGCDSAKNSNGQCGYEEFHEKIAKKLAAIVAECNEFHGVKAM